MAVTVVQRIATQAFTSGVSASVTFAAPVTTGNLIVVGFQANGAGLGAATGTDSQGNTYIQTPSSPINNGGSSNEYMLYAPNVIGGSSFQVTVTLAIPGSAITLVAYEISGIDPASSFIADSASSGSGTSISSGTVALSGHTGIIVAQMVASAGTLSSYGTGYTGFSSDDSSPASGNLNGFIHDEYHLVSADEAAAAVQSSSTLWAIVAAAFKASSTGSALTVVGAGGVMWTGTALTASSWSALGAGATVWTGAPTVAAALTALGAGAAAWVGTGLIAATWAATGAGTANWVFPGFSTATFTALGAGAVAAVGRATVAVTWAATGVGSSVWTGVTRVAATWAATGTGSFLAKVPGKIWRRTLQLRIGTRTEPEKL